MARGDRMAKPAKVMLNVPAIKADFPILQRTIRDKRLVYLDSAATSQKPKQVIDATSDFYSRYNANVHRAIYELGEESTREYEGAREKVAAFIQAKSPTEIAFTKSTTESINVVAYGYGLKGKIQKGDEIVGTVMEHHSNHVPWHFVKDHKGAVLKYVDVNDDGTLKMEQYDALLTNRTKIVTVTLCSNVLGTINPVKEIAKRAHEVGAICVVDAAQAAPHMPIDVQSLDADFLAFSGHKMLGPTGIGVLYGKQELFEATEPLLGGGEMIREVHLGWAKWNDVPYKFEGGTPNIAGAIGLGAAVDYLTKIGMEAVRGHEMEITEYALEKLGRLKGVTTYGPKDVRRGPASCPSRSTARTRTTSPRSSMSKGSASVRATTAPSRSWSGSTSPRPHAPPSTSTTTWTTPTRSSRASRRSRRSSPEVDLVRHVSGTDPGPLQAPAEQGPARRRHEERPGLEPAVRGRGRPPCEGRWVRPNRRGEVRGPGLRDQSGERIDAHDDGEGDAALRCRRPRQGRGAEETRHPAECRPSEVRPPLPSRAQPRPRPEGGRWDLRRSISCVRLRSCRRPRALRTSSGTLRSSPSTD